MSTPYKRRYFIITDTAIIQELYREYDALKAEILNKICEKFPDLSIDGYTFLPFGGNRELINGLIVEQLPPDNRYKVEHKDNSLFITPNTRSNKGKAFEAKLRELNSELSTIPLSPASFFEKKFNAGHYIRFVENGQRYIANPVIQSIKEKIVISIPTNDDDSHFPTLPDYVTEIKHSEYIAITEE